MWELHDVEKIPGVIMKHSLKSPFSETAPLHGHSTAQTFNVTEFVHSKKKKKHDVKPLTCCGDAVKAYEGVEAGGSTGQDSSQAERSEAAHAKLLLDAGLKKDTLR